MKPTRDGCGEALLDLGRRDSRIVVLSADLTESVRANVFKARFPERFFSFGISEQDMMSAAAGFALEGKIPFACTFAVFASGRAWDQIRTSMAYMNLNVNIIGSHGGITVGPDGATHQALEDITLMRVLPNMSVVVPCDYYQAKKAVEAAAYYPGPVYLRFTRNKVPFLTSEDDVFELGKAQIMRDGSDITLVASGQIVHLALKAADILKEDKISARVINLHTVKPLDRNALLKAAKDTGAILSIEEHQIFGGMGSAIAEFISENRPVLLKLMGIRDRFGRSGESDILLEAFGLTSEYIAKEAKELLKKKQL
ncbi:MAG TPA: transketolase family protein [Candidatus Omnitrophica bacterium]|nr:transketolase family protein [Candidatus Omnitrophota bacterium]